MADLSEANLFAAPAAGRLANVARAGELGGANRPGATGRADLADADLRGRSRTRI